MASFFTQLTAALRQLFKLRMVALSNTSAKGSRAEGHARQWLKSQGYRIVAANIADDRGELDLLVHPPGDSLTLAVVEVRSSSSQSTLRHDMLFPPAKQRQVEDTARRLLVKRRLVRPGMGVRFDVVFVRLDDAGNALEVQHFPHAFTARRRDWL